MPYFVLQIYYKTKQDSSQEKNTQGGTKPNVVTLAKYVASASKFCYTTDYTYACACRDNADY